MIAPSQKLRVLLVDDSSIARDLIRSSLAEVLKADGRGYELVELTEGRGALERLAKERFDLLLLDWVLPKFHGSEVLKQVRANPALSRLPIVVISSAPDETRDQALNLGANAFVSKPVVNSRLTEALHTVLSIKG
ncbi:MAG TPA: response regulator [Myxococcales bacterium]|jgi:CheY-like chemotaxis protein